MVNDQTPNVDGVKEPTQDQMPEPKTENPKNSVKNTGDLSVALKIERQKTKELNERLSKLESLLTAKNEEEKTIEQQLEEIKAASKKKDKILAAKEFTKDKDLIDFLIFGTDNDEQVKEKYEKFTKKYKKVDFYESELKAKDAEITQLKEKLTKAGIFQTPDGSKNTKVKNEQPETIEEYYNQYIT